MLFEMRYPETPPLEEIEWEQKGPPWQDVGTCGVLESGNELSCLPEASQIEAYPLCDKNFRMENFGSMIKTKQGFKSNVYFHIGCSFQIKGKESLSSLQIKDM